MEPPAADMDWALARYDAVRARLPAMPPTVPGKVPGTARSLADLADRYDGFVLDAFGVLNVGDRPIPGAVDRLASLTRAGRRIVVLTNAASYPRAAAPAKFRALGFDLAADQVVSSRDVAAARLDRVAPGVTWAAITAAGDDLADIPAPCRALIDDPGALAAAGGILFLSSARWSAPAQARLVAALRDRPRPVVVANPDLVAPREGGLTLEPGLFGHALLDALAADLHWFGKPFAEAFAEGIARTGLDPDRLAMVGDTLHTDVLGGKAAGCRTVLVTDHGLFAGRDTGPFIAASGIVPDFIVPDP